MVKCYIYESHRRDLDIKSQSQSVSNEISIITYESPCYLLGMKQFPGFSFTTIISFNQANNNLFHQKFELVCYAARLTKKVV